MIVERDNNFLVQPEDKWMLNDMKAYANIKNTNKQTNAQNVYTEVMQIIDKD